MLCAAVAAALPGCAYVSEHLHPRPNVLLNPSSDTLRLVLPEVPGRSARVSDNIPTGISLEVLGWRNALAYGFRQAFTRYFRIVDERAPADWTLTIVEAIPSLVVLSLGKHVTRAGEIRFQATLVRAGQAPRPLAATVSARRVMISPDATETIESAIEAMYELIAERLFAKRVS
jgi:ABC-type amino acid transport system permease subunit